MKPSFVVLCLAAWLIACAQAENESDKLDSHYEPVDEDDDYSYDEDENQSNWEDEYDWPVEEPSQAALFPSDEDEVAALVGPAKAVYKDYCISMRDFLQETLDTKLNEGSAKVFEIIIGSGKALAVGALKMEEIESAKAIESLKKGELLEIDTNGDGKLSIKEIEQAPEELDENGNPVRAGILSRLISTFKYVLMKMATGAADEMNDKIRELRSNFKVDRLEDILDETCKQINANVKVPMERELEKVKREIRSEQGDSQDGGLPDDIGNYDLESLGCITTMRIVRASKLCRTFKTVLPLVTTVAENFRTRSLAATAARNIN